MSDTRSKCCPNCPFRRDVIPYITLERADQFATSATNPYNDFPCHETFEHVEDDYGFERIAPRGKRVKTCHGFRKIQVNECVDDPDFKADPIGFNDSSEMFDYYEEYYELAADTG